MTLGFRVTRPRAMCDQQVTMTLNGKVSKMSQGFSVGSGLSAAGFGRGGGTVACGDALPDGMPKANSCHRPTSLDDPVRYCGRRADLVGPNGQKRTNGPMRLSFGIITMACKNGQI